MGRRVIKLLIFSPSRQKSSYTTQAINSFASLMTLRLSDMKPGQAGVIQEFDDESIFLKLMEMGCVPGELILLEQVAPLGDPISVTIAGYRLSLRLNEAKHIIVDLNS